MENAGDAASSDVGVAETVRVLSTLSRASLIGGLAGLLLAPPVVGATCQGDCDGDGVVTIADLMTGVPMVFGTRSTDACPDLDRDGDRRITAAELVAAVRAALDGCPADPTPTTAAPTSPTPTLPTPVEPTATTAVPASPPPATPTSSPPASPTPAGLVTLAASSPAHGESDVAITRETVLRFSGPLDPATVTLQAIFASFGGEHLGDTIHLSRDGTTVTLFYAWPFLPPGARVRVIVDGNRLRDRAGRPVDADGDGAPGGLRFVDFDTLGVSTVPGTAVCGRVFASELATAPDGTSVNRPLAGVTITVDGREQEMRAVTDDMGNFRLEPAPAGRFFVHIDGRTATAGVPEGAYYPLVGKAWESVAGEETNIGEVYLPLVAPGTLQPVSETEDTTITFPPSVLAQHPELEGVQVTVPAGSLYSESGLPGGMVGIAPVPPDRMPGPPPLGLEFPIVITVQSDTGTNFDTPAPVCFPNLPLPETGEPLAPGAKSALWSFNHDSGRWELQGSMTVTDDGRLVCTDPGVGISAPGWHGSRPAVSLRDGPITSGASDPFEKGTEHTPPGRPCDDECERWIRRVLRRLFGAALFADRKGGSKDHGGDSDPIYLFSGEFYEAVEDIRIRGRGFDFVWARKYRSLLGPNTAQGNGWDFSYNIYLERGNGDLVLHDGNSRRDRYRLRIGKWRRSEFFREITCECSGPGGIVGPECNQLCGLPGTLFIPAGASAGRGAQESTARLIVTFDDGGFWEFHPFDDSRQAGKIRRSVDRNGNQMRFEYDDRGRLSRILDTLDRPIDVAYNADGLIASVTDFTGRQVRYEYYRQGEPGGLPGDLKSVTTFAVTGTPNGNDFPDGKTWTYTYAVPPEGTRRGGPPKLLTITDPKGQTYLRNVYEEIGEGLLGRVVRQIWGNPDDVIDIAYVRQEPSESNGHAVIKAIVNDRVGNVREYFFDAARRLVIRREYTGRANPRAPTTEAVNRPSGKLRESDPDFFETRYEWNDDSLLAREVRPNGNAIEYVYESDLNPAAPARFRANLRAVRRLPGSHQPAGDQEAIEEHFEYDPRFGGAQFVTRHTDGRGNVTLYEYDERGNRTRAVHRIPSIVEDFEYNRYGQLTAHVWPDNGSNHRRRDEFTYYEDGPQRGYLRSMVADAGGFDLTTTFEYDRVGNIVRITDPRGHDTRYVVNQRDQVVREISREVGEGSGVRYQRDFFYDANDNIVRVEVENIDGEGRLQQDNPRFTTTIEREILDLPVRTTVEVDPGHAIVTEIEYDGNRNPIRFRSGEATNGNQPANVLEMLYDERDLLFRTIRAPGDPAQSTTQIDYDRNGNRITVRRGIEEEPRVWKTVFDGFDRPFAHVDPMGNTMQYHYDANDNVVSTRTDGELVDEPGEGEAVRLGEASYLYDPMDRLVESRRAFFDTESQQPIGDGASVVRMEYSDNSQLLRVENDNGHAVRHEYDTANRLRRATDPKGNTVEYEYDANSNLVRRTEVERSDLGSPDETFVTRYAYDNLDRLIEHVDNVGNTHRYGWDSRQNLVRHLDAKGNVTRTVYDGLNRMTERIYELRAGGEGSGDVTGTIRTRYLWDDSSRLVGRSDDNGHTTRYTYDPLDRRTAVVLADGTAHAYTYDVHDNVVSMTDANGTTVVSTYDLLDRLTRNEVTPGPGVSSDTTFESFAYDGLSRLVAAEDDDSRVERGYDSLSQVVREVLDGQESRWLHDGVGNVLEMTFPGGRRLSCTYDELERKKTVTDTATGLVARHDYIGRWRLERRTYGNGARSEFAYDGVRRIVRTAHFGPGGTPLDDRRYAWDPMYRKTERRDLLADITESFRYDSIYRLVEVLRSGAAGLPPTTAYRFDGAQNRLEVSGGPDAGAYGRDTTLPEPGDFQVNQYSATPFDLRRYDRNGNLVEIAPEQRTVAYDYLDRMVSYEGGAGVRAHYRYDALGRRIERAVEEDGSSETVRYFYDGWQVCEEQDEENATRATYVYGLGLDDVLQMRRGTDFYYHQDDLGSITALSDGSGALAERYRYADYGAPAILDPSGAPLERSAAGNPYGFTGRRFDPESGWYYYRTRYLDPRAGRFTTRDSIGMWGDPKNLGNGYAYAGNDPANHTDPLGLQGDPGRPLRRTAQELSSVLEEQLGAATAKMEAAARAIESASRNEMQQDFLRRTAQELSSVLEEQLGAATAEIEAAARAIESTSRNQKPEASKAPPPAPPPPRKPDLGQFAEPSFPAFPPPHCERGRFPHAALRHLIPTALTLVQSLPPYAQEDGGWAPGVVGQAPPPLEFRELPASPPGRPLRPRGGFR
ncbi:MAG: hypothetical protein KatS3mg076_0063 [Candidatus Binatia bacterium]|nr:MAG: hypothetical protein KatS3mg076_0063 [Candidatus Binatia bacterium]